MQVMFWDIWIMQIVHVCQFLEYFYILFYYFFVYYLDFFAKNTFFFIANADFTYSAIYYNLIMYFMSCDT